jgi:hypothetical protein
MTTTQRVAVTVGLILTVVVLALAVFFFSFLSGGEKTCLDPDGSGPQIEVCN